MKNIKKSIVYILMIAINLYGCKKDDSSSPLTYGTMTDQDGNVYKTITINSKTWSVENLKTTKYRNGEPIPIVTNGATWAALSTGAYCWYNNDEAANKANYGALYNWFAISDSRNLAPTGWHVATNAEWTSLITFLGGENIAGGKMKETGTTHYTSPNTGATNESGFAALPSGYRSSGDGAFLMLGKSGFWWSSTAYDVNFAWTYAVGFDDAGCYRSNYDKPGGSSVRLVKD
jgi:uncharacterized protein (TIGR02145 family)